MVHTHHDVRHKKFVRVRPTLRRKHTAAESVKAKGDVADFKAVLAADEKILAEMRCGEGSAERTCERMMGVGEMEKWKVRTSGKVMEGGEREKWRGDGMEG